MQNFSEPDNYSWWDTQLNILLRNCPVVWIEDLVKDDIGRLRPLYDDYYRDRSIHMESLLRAKHDTGSKRTQEPHIYLQVLYKHAPDHVKPLLSEHENSITTPIGSRNRITENIDIGPATDLLPRPPMNLVSPASSRVSSRIDLMQQNYDSISSWSSGVPILPDSSRDNFPDTPPNIDIPESVSRAGRDLQQANPPLLPKFSAGGVHQQNTLDIIAKCFVPKASS